jgi:mannose-6-phosphate isomerase-like protein (cupin superfamily)
LGSTFLATVERWNVEVDGPLSESALRRKLERLGYRVSRYVYPPGTEFPAHRHEVEKMDAVVAGRFRIVMQGESVGLGLGDAILVPCGAEHSAEVVGNESVISLDAVKRKAYPG